MADMLRGFSFLHLRAGRRPRLSGAAGSALSSHRGLRGVTIAQLSMQTAICGGQWKSGFRQGTGLISAGGTFWADQREPPARRRLVEFLCHFSVWFSALKWNSLEVCKMKL